MRSRLEAIFPAPSFLSMPAVGIDVSDRSIRYAELLPKGGSFVVGKYGTVRIPEGGIDGGRIMDKGAVTGVLREIRKKNGFRLARVALPEEQVYLFTALLPAAASGTLRDAVELILEEHVPIKAADSVFGFDVISSSPAGILVNVHVVSAEVSREYAEAFRDAGFLPLSLELEAAAISRSVVPEHDPATYMLVDLGETRTGVSVASRGIIRFATTIEIGGASLTAAASKAMGVPKEEAERKKRRSGLLRSPQNRELFSAMVAPASILRDEINRQYIYWHTHRDQDEKGKQKIMGIMLSGTDAAVPGLADYLSVSLRLPVRCANPWANISPFDRYIPPIPYEESLAYATALGLALRRKSHD